MKATVLYKLQEPLMRCIQGLFGCDQLSSRHREPSADNFGYAILRNTEIGGEPSGKHIDWTRAYGNKVGRSSRKSRWGKPEYPGAPRRHARALAAVSRLAADSADRRRLSPGLLARPPLVP